MKRSMDRRTVAKGAGIAAAISLLQGTTSGASASAQATPEPTLYDRVGGIFDIAAVVNRFSDAIIINSKLNVNPALEGLEQTEAETRLPGLKFGRDPVDRGPDRRTLYVHWLAAERSPHPVQVDLR